MAQIFGNSRGDPDQFRRLLDEQYEWPAAYMFKFIVPLRQFDELQRLLDGHELITRTSSKGNYVSVTLSPIVDSTEAVLDMYIKASLIDGLVAL